MGDGKVRIRELVHAGSSLEAEEADHSRLHRLHVSHEFEKLDDPALALCSNLTWVRSLKACGQPGSCGRWQVSLSGYRPDHELL